MEEAPNEVEELTKRIEEAGMSKEAHSKAVAELNNQEMSPMLPRRRSSELHRRAGCALKAYARSPRSG